MRIAMKSVPWLVLRRRGCRQTQALEGRPHILASLRQAGEQGRIRAPQTSHVRLPGQAIDHRVDTHCLDDTLISDLNTPCGSCVQMIARCLLESNRKDYGLLERSAHD